MSGIDAGLLAGPFYAIAGLLAVAGVGKLVAPAAAAQALRGVGVPFAGGAARLLGGFEVAIGLTAVLTGGRIAAAALAVAYLGFGAFVVVSMRQPQSAPCGCFGRADVPPGPVHLAVDAAAGAVALASVARPVGPVFDVLDGDAFGVVTFVLYVVLAVYLLYVTLTALPRLTTAARS